MAKTQLHPNFFLHTGDIISNIVLDAANVENSDVYSILQDSTPIQLDVRARGRLFTGVQVKAWGGLEPRDRVVHDLACGIWKEYGPEPVPLSRWTKTFSQRNTADVKDTFRSSLERLGSTEVLYLWRDKRGTEQSEEGPLLNLSFSVNPIKGVQTECVTIEEKPLLLDLSEEIGQLKFIPARLIYGDGEYKRPLQVYRLDYLAILFLLAADLVTTGKAKRPIIRVDRLERVFRTKEKAKPARARRAICDQVWEILETWKQAGFLQDCQQNKEGRKLASFSWVLSPAFTEKLQKEQEKEKRKNRTKA